MKSPLRRLCAILIACTVAALHTLPLPEFVVAEDANRDAAHTQNNDLPIKIPTIE